MRCSGRREPGHVTGGRVFGYDNVDIPGADGKRSHVERSINDDEAAVVRRIFELCAKGWAAYRSPRQLNAEGAPAPRAQQGRPQGLGTVVHSRGPLSGSLSGRARVEQDAQARHLGPSEAECPAGIRLDARARAEAANRFRCALAAAHERLGTGARVLLERQRGQAVGPSPERCGLEVSPDRPGPLWPLWGQLRGAEPVATARAGPIFYVCAQLLPPWSLGLLERVGCVTRQMEAAVLDALEPLLTPTFIETVVHKVLTRAIPTGSDRMRPGPRSRAKPTRLGASRQLDRRSGQDGNSSGVTTAIKDREARLSNLEQDLAALEGRRSDLTDGSRPARTTGPRKSLRAGVRSSGRTRPRRVRSSRRCCVIDRASSPENATATGYRFRGEGTIWPLLSGVIPDLDVSGKRWRPQRDSNPCFGLERATSWASGRWGLLRKPLPKEPRMIARRRSAPEPAHASTVAQ